jgi:hypothetical protein
MWRNATGTITVTPNTLQVQQVQHQHCVSVLVLTDITHATTGATVETYGLPAGELPQHLFRIPLQLVVHQLYREHSTILFH